MYNNKLLDPKEENHKGSSNNKEECKVDPKLLENMHNKTDLFLLSQLKQLNHASILKEEELDADLSNNKNKADYESSTPPINKDDDSCFEVPKLRFPVAPNRGLTQKCVSGGRAEEAVTQAPCKWEGCQEVLDSTGKLLDHLRIIHTLSQNPEEKEEDFQYKCMWKGCKVFGRGSSSKSWLEKHVVGNHTGSKPFQCIVDGCKMRFGTQSLLERHVNGHFKMSSKVIDINVDTSSSSSTNNASNVNQPPSSVVKQIRRVAGKN